MQDRRVTIHACNLGLRSGRNTRAEMLDQFFLNTPQSQFLRLSLTM
jgi:hypothetical protein